MTLPEAIKSYLTHLQAVKPYVLLKDFPLLARLPFEYLANRHGKDWPTAYPETHGHAKQCIGGPVLDELLTNVDGSYTRDKRLYAEQYFRMQINLLNETIAAEEMLDKTKDPVRHIRLRWATLMTIMHMHLLIKNASEDPVDLMCTVFSKHHGIYHGYYHAFQDQFYDH